MDAALKKRWVTALRSGKYVQGYGSLRRYVQGYESLLQRNYSQSVPHERPCKHCCLGVLCDLIDPKGWDGESRYRADAWFSENYLPTPIANMLGFDDPDPHINITYGDHVITTTLGALNDSGCTFNQIADVIQWYFPDEAENPHVNA